MSDLFTILTDKIKKQNKALDKYLLYRARADLADYKRYRKEVESLLPKVEQALKSKQQEIFTEDA